MQAPPQRSAVRLRMKEVNSAVQPWPRGPAVEPQWIELSLLPDERDVTDVDGCGLGVGGRDGDSVRLGVHSCPAVGDGHMRAVATSCDSGRCALAARTDRWPSSGPSTSQSVAQLGDAGSRSWSRGAERRRVTAPAGSGASGGGTGFAAAGRWFFAPTKQENVLIPLAARDHWPSLSTPR
jgi:hypothetical protein